MKCQDCYTEEGTIPVCPTLVTDNDRSNGPNEQYKMLCETCAKEAIESGDYELDE